MTIIDYLFLNRHVSFVTYECNPCNPEKNREMTKTLHKYGFICYMGGTTQLFVRISGCYDDMVHLEEEDKVYKSKYPPVDQMRPSQRLAGNVYCGHVRRSPGLIQAMESHSLHTYAHKKRGDPYFEALLGREGVWVRNGSEIILPGKEKLDEEMRRNGRNITTGKIPILTKS